MHKDELWQEYDLTGKPLENGGRLASLGNPALADKVRCGIAIVQIYRQVGNDYEILFQQRSMKVDNPGEWDLSAGGHIKYGESLQDAAVREAKEEIGVDINKNKLKLACGDVFCNISHTFFYDWGDRKDGFKFDDEEVMAIKWVKLSELDGFWKNKLKKYLAEDEIYLAEVKRFFVLEKRRNGDITK